MSTTDTRAAFEAWAQKEGYNVSLQIETGRYWDSHVEARWQGYQAAKATGTAGEQDKPYGFLWYTEHMEYRFTCQHPIGCYKVLGEVTPVYTRPAPAEAARQPAPVVAVKTWQERMGQDPALLELGALHQENAELRAVLSCLLHQTEGDICEMRKMKATIADLRAALAATNQSQPAQVVARMVDVEDVKQLCRDYSSRTGSVYIGDVEATLDALAARSQP